MILVEKLEKWGSAFLQSAIVHGFQVAQVGENSFFKLLLYGDYSTKAFKAIS